MRAYEVARELGVPVTTHAGVWGATNDDGIRLAHEAGFLDETSIFVHAATLSADSYHRIAATGGSVSVSTESEQSAGQGYPPTWALRAHGIPVSLSMDTSVWWSGDLFSAMRATLGADRSREHLEAHAKGETVTHRALRAEQVVEWATRGGARALGRESDLGSIEVGKKADLVLLKNDHSPVSFPLLNPHGHVAFQAQRGDVHTVLVDGRVVKHEHRLVDVDLAGCPTRGRGHRGAPALHARGRGVGEGHEPGRPRDGAAGEPLHLQRLRRRDARAVSPGDPRHEESDRRIRGELAGLGYENGASGVGELPGQVTAADPVDACLRRRAGRAGRVRPGVLVGGDGLAGRSSVVGTSGIRLARAPGRDGLRARPEHRRPAARAPRPAWPRGPGHDSARLGSARLEELGATRGPTRDWWQVMSSPAGLPFCLCDERWPHHRPGAVSFPDGHRSRVVQLCVDVPADHYDAEFAFWRAATGWADEAVDAPEFQRLVHRAESPPQLLVQRLGPDDGAAQARAHLDLGTDDIAAEIARVEALGAHVLRHGDGFVALQGPGGPPFCVTANDPDRGRTRWNHVFRAALSRPPVNHTTPQ